MHGMESKASSMLTQVHILHGVDSKLLFILLLCLYMQLAQQVYQQEEGLSTDSSGHFLFLGGRVVYKNSL